MSQVLVNARPDKYIQLLRKRNQLSSLFEADGYFRKSSPHITLFKRFKIEDSDESKVKEIVRNNDIDIDSMESYGLSSGNSLTSPRAIFIDVDLDIQDELETLAPKLENYAKTPVKPITDHHITLLKSRKWWDELPESMQKCLDREIQHHTPRQNIGIDRVRAEIRHPR